MYLLFLKNENESQISTDESEHSSRSPGNKPNHIKSKAAPWNSFLPPPPPMPVPGPRPGPGKVTYTQRKFLRKNSIVLQHSHPPLSHL